MLRVTDFVTCVVGDRLAMVPNRWSQPKLDAAISLANTRRSETERSILEKTICGHSRRLRGLGRVPIVSLTRIRIWLEIEVK